MKRIICIVLAVVLVLGLLGMVSLSVFAEVQTFTTSDACIALLKELEGFCEKPVWDYSQYTVGYGTRCPDDMLDYYNKNGITQEEAETLLRNYISVFEKEINERIVQKYSLELTQNQFDALLSFSYNCGTGWTYNTDGVFFKAITSGATGNDLIRAFALWCSAGGEVQTYLLRRRLSEANMYLNNVYSKTPPENYCYVLYNANGGTTSPRTQGYDSDMQVAPFPTPVFEGYTFEGWYTERVGGEKVEALTSAHNGTTLYAHWVDSNGESNYTKPGDVTVTVTGIDVNVRSGPGTNYAKVGTVTKGDKLVITETTSAGGRVWGKFDKGWVALQYTNYETVIHDNTGEQQPEPSVPEPSVPEPSKPEPSEPEPSKPEPSVPEETKPDNSGSANAGVYGIIKVNEWLRVRSGPGTGYSVVEYLKPNQRVEILEQKVVGSVTWGKISTGWISMRYVVLESNSGSGNSGTSGSVGSGTIVNCTTLRIRSGAGTSYSIVGYLNRGDKVSFSEYKKVGSVTWGKISNGWISLDYVTLDSSGNGGTSTPSTGVYGTVKVDEWLRIRTGPGTSYAVAGYMKPNERVEILERKTVGAITWGKTSKGWISMAYVVLDGSGSSSSSSGSTASKTRTVTATTLNVRSGAGTGYSIVGFLYNGAKVQVLETKTVNGQEWGKISNGWICLQYTK